jgi:UDP-glucose 4-epimerase
VEHYLFIYRKHFGIDYTILRYANIYGPRQDPLGEAGVVAIWTNQMLNGAPAVVYGSGEQERDFVYVGDVARANVLALTRGDGEIVNLGSGIGSTINQVFERLKSSTGYTGEAIHEEAKQGEVFRIYITNARAKAVLGWEPTVSLQEGLDRTVAHFRERM